MTTQPRSGSGPRPVSAAQYRMQTSAIVPLEIQSAFRPLITTWSAESAATQSGRPYSPAGWKICRLGSSWSEPWPGSVVAQQPSLVPGVSSSKC